MPHSRISGGAVSYSVNITVLLYKLKFGLSQGGENGKSGITHEKCIHRKETKYKIKKAEREAAAMPPSRSDRWQANFCKKVRAVRFQSRSAAANGRAAAGSAADFLR